MIFNDVNTATVKPKLFSNRGIAHHSRRIHYAPKIKLDCAKEEVHLQTNLQFYTYATIETITLDEFEKLVKWRVKLHQDLENAENEVSQKDLAKGELENKYTKILEDSGLNIATYSTQKRETEGQMKKLQEEMAQRRKDHISHWLLRIVFGSKDDDERRWLVEREIKLFRYRFELERPDILASFFKLNEMDYEQVDIKSDSVLHERIQCTSSYIMRMYPNGNIYRIPFEEASSMVARRKVYLQKGFAYVHIMDMINVLAQKLRENLQYSLAQAKLHVAALDEETRLTPIINTVNRSAYMGKEYNSGEQKITPPAIEELHKQSFPLCMRVIHEALHETGHIKHGGRQQYGLFLKACGLSLEDALLFFRQQFAKKIDGDQFNKQYAYNIRHMYGKEGKRTNYSAYSCHKIIESRLAPGDNHGCPFKHWESGALREYLNKIMPVGSASKINVIIDMKNRHQYDRACTRTFELIHKLADSEKVQLISHPNQYFENSLKYYKGELLFEPSSDVKSQPNDGDVTSKNNEECDDLIIPDYIKDEQEKMECCDDDELILDDD